MNLEKIQHQTKELILQYSIPSIIAMLLTSFVTIVDGLFISNYVGKEALSSIHLGLPLLYLFLGVSIMIGVGGVSMAGHALGNQNHKRGIDLFNQTYWTGFITIVMLALLSQMLIEPIITLFNIDLSLSNYFLDYYHIIIWIYPLMMMNIINGMFIRAEGKPQFFMMISLLMNIINIGLDYYLIARLGLGVTGAATASGISIAVGFLLMHVFIFKGTAIFKFKRFTFSKEDFKMTFLNGSSELIGQLSLSITNFLFNAVVLAQIGITGVAALTLVGYTGYIFDMIVVGFGQGTSPIISFCHGANEKSLCLKVRTVTVKIVTIVGGLFYFLLALTGRKYAGIFTQDLDLINFVTTGLHIFTISFLLIGYNVLSSFFFTATGRPKESAIISSARGLVIISIAIFIFPTIFGVVGIWMVGPITEILTALIVIKFIKQEKLAVCSA